MLLGCLLLAACGDSETRDDPTQACHAIEHLGMPYTVCSYTRAETDIRLFHSDADGAPYLQFDTLIADLDAQDKTLAFAMNGGMYHEDRSPVGFYRDANGDQASVNTNEGPGNFHMRPNGVFWLSEDRAGITESQAYLDAGIDPDFATQSGPMLVIDGALHPGLNPDGTSRKRRNGVGVSADGTLIHFAISDTVVSFHDFATLFRDALGADNALFLDGQVSRIYAPELQRNETGVDLGPIVGVVE
ncbi:MAG: phosphodiester glycosidase family protein [Henriciella sp.]|nr:phosphodiester glycosidase family protein [Henriciella sp.]